MSDLPRMAALALMMGLAVDRPRYEPPIKRARKANPRTKAKAARKANQKRRKS